MTRREQRAFAERERVARQYWRMVVTGWGNQAGHDNPYLRAVVADIEDRYPWLKEEPDDHGEPPGTMINRG